MYTMVSQTNLILVYGSSGTGKSSLVQCGLASKFDTHDWQSIFVRRGTDINASLDKALIDAGGTIDENDDLDWLDQDWSATETTPAALTEKSLLSKRINAIHLKNFKPIYLIFDQFEELYIFGNDEERNKFYQNVKELTFNEKNVKIIILIREEYLGYLYGFEKVIPQLLKKKIRVEPMNLAKVTDVVRGLANSKNTLITIKPGEEEKFAEMVFDRLKGGENKINIELPYLQVFFDKLYLNITHDESRETPAEFSIESLNKIGDIGDILRNLIDEQVDQIVKKCNLSAENVWKFLSAFVSLDGTKDPKSMDEIQELFCNDKEIPIRVLLNELVSRRILRKDKNESVYEIAHDSLAKQISMKRSDDEIALLEIKRMIHSSVSIKEESREYFTEKQLAFIMPLTNKLQLNEEEREWLEKSDKHVQKIHAEEEARHQEELRRTKKRLRQTMVGLLVMLIAFGYAGIQSFKASRAKQKSEILLSDDYRSLGLRLLASGDSARIERAKTLFGKIIDDLVPRAEDYGYLGTCYWSLGDKEKAFMLYQQCLRQAQNGKRYEERYDLELKTELLPQEKAVAEAYRLLSHCYFEKNAFGNAFESACNAVAAYPDEYDGWYDVSKYALFVSKYQESIDAAERALQLKPKQEEVMRFVALSNALNNNLEESEAIYKKYFNVIFHSNGPDYSKNPLLTYDTTWLFSTPMFFEDMNTIKDNGMNVDHLDFVETLLNEKLNDFLSEIEMVDVKGGQFTMGTGTDPNAVPHQVLLSDYSIGKYEVTQRLWTTIMGYNPSACQGDDLPVENMTWNEAMTFIERLNKVTQQQYRMPTEAEWEYAAMGGNQSHNYIYSGFNDINGKANYKSKTAADIGHPIKVGSYVPNELGIYDMCGNVWEWCADWFGVYNDTYSPKDENDKWDPDTPMVNPTGKVKWNEFDNKVLRGGSFDSEKGRCAVKNRHHHNPSMKGQFYGMRLAR